MPQPEVSVNTPEKEKVEISTFKLMKIGWKVYSKGKDWYKKSKLDGKIDSDELLILFKLLADAIHETFGYELSFDVTPVEEIVNEITEENEGEM